MSEMWAGPILDFSGMTEEQAWTMLKRALLEKGRATLEPPGSPPAPPETTARLITAVLERGGEFEGLGVRVKLPPPKPPLAETKAKDPNHSRLGRELAQRKALLTEE